MAGWGSTLYAMDYHNFRQTDTCSDCIERDDVDLLGRIRKGRYARVAECMGCNGSGRTKRERIEIVSWWVTNRDKVTA